MGYFIILLMIILIYANQVRVENIKGCEARGEAAGDTYMRRWHLLTTKNWRIYAHYFKRSDADDLHDHPWDFITFVLWGGYWEEYKIEFRDREEARIAKAKRVVHNGKVIYYLARRFVKPFTINKRKAELFHRVELKEGKKAFTLVFVHNHHKSWGFLIKGKYIQWREYFKKMNCES